jgi:hypothetical protein
MQEGMQAHLILTVAHTKVWRPARSPLFSSSRRRSTTQLTFCDASFVRGCIYKRTPTSHSRMCILYLPPNQP